MIDLRVEKQKRHISPRQLRAGTSGNCMETTQQIMCVFNAVLMLTTTNGTRHGVPDRSLTHAEILQRARVPRIMYTFCAIEIFDYCVGLILEDPGIGKLGAKHVAPERPAPYARRRVASVVTIAPPEASRVPFERRCFNA